MAATTAYWAVWSDTTAAPSTKDAATAARHATADTLNLWMSMWALPELVKATGYCGDAGLARDARRSGSRTGHDAARPLASSRPSSPAP